MTKTNKTKTTTQNEDNPETQATLGKQDTGRRQSRDAGNIGHKTQNEDKKKPHITEN